LKVVGILVFGCGAVAVQRGVHKPVPERKRFRILTLEERIAPGRVDTH